MSSTGRKISQERQLPTCRWLKAVSVVFFDMNGVTTTPVSARSRYAWLLVVSKVEKRIEMGHTSRSRRSRGKQNRQMRRRRWTRRISNVATKPMGNYGTGRCIERERGKHTQKRKIVRLSKIAFGPSSFSSHTPRMSVLRHFERLGGGRFNRYLMRLKFWTR